LSRHGLIALLIATLQGGVQATEPSTQPPRATPYGPAVAADRQLWAFAFHPREPLLLLQIGDAEHYSLYVSRRDRRGRWSAMRPWSRAKAGADDSDPFFSPDGRQLFFARRSWAGADHHDIWVASYEGGRWGTPQPLPAAINTALDEYLPTVAANGDLYFERGGKGQQFDLFVARRRAQAYAEPERLPPTINSAADEESPFVRPDGSSLLFVRGAQLLQSRRQGQGWSEARALYIRESGPLVYSPYVSPDGRWLFYTSNASGKARLMRVPYAAVQPR
jgi:Tol biopolymer transport system component